MIGTGLPLCVWGWGWGWGGWLRRGSIEKEVHASNFGIPKISKKEVGHKKNIPLSTQDRVNIVSHRKHQKIVTRCPEDKKRLDSEDLGT